jgi:hypothetical protein
MNEEKTYILLRDTYGKGLEQFYCHGLEVYSDWQLEEAKAAAIDEILSEDGSEDIEEYIDMYSEDFLYNQVVVLEITNQNGKSDV